MYQSRRVVRNPELVASWKNLKHTNKKYKKSEVCTCKDCEVTHRHQSPHNPYRMATREKCKKCGNIYVKEYKVDPLGFDDIKLLKKELVT